jgi:adenosylhomocysteine nucleosidase
MAALPEELQELLDLMPDEACVRRAGRTFWVGHLDGQPIVAVLSGIGKVAAALTATALCQTFGVRGILFTGVAGGLGAAVNVGDVVVADALVQHDMDASPLFPRHVVPEFGHAELPVPASWSDALASAVEEVLPAWAHAPERAALGLLGPTMHRGLVLSGDRFVSSLSEVEALRLALPQALAVEMEGAAVAQICLAHGLPFAVVRTISDRADASAHVDFARFVQSVASAASLAVLRAALPRLARVQPA